MTTKEKTVEWDGNLNTRVLDALQKPAGLVVSATKVGYILMATDGPGLERKFSAKERNRNKPGVVLCADLDQLAELAELNDEIATFYKMHWESDTLLGCILPWREDALDLLPDETTAELAMDARRTSCFVVRYGLPAEQLVQELWKERRLVFASSANPSGLGNQGRVELIGDQIFDESDAILEANTYVDSNQPGLSIGAREEQGVMVSMVDQHGKLIPMQEGQRSIVPCPTIIRKGLDLDAIMENLATTFNSWDFRHGQYY